MAKIGVAAAAIVSAAMAIGPGCEWLTSNKDKVVATTDAACEFVSAAVSLAPDGVVNAEVANGLALACVAAKAGSRSISAVVYDDPNLQAACAGPSTGTAAYLALRSQIGCR